MKTKLKRGQTIYFWWSASEVFSVQFIKWIRMRKSTGRKEDTNQLGVGVKVKSNWLFQKEIVKRIPHNCKRSEYVLRPYDDIYLTDKSAWKHKNKVARPMLANCTRCD